MTLASSRTLRSAFHSVLTPQQRALAAHRIGSGERVLCGELFDTLRHGGACSLSVIASGGSFEDRDHDDEALALTEALVRHCGCRSFQEAYDGKLVLSHYFSAVMESSQKEILDALS